MLDLMKRKLIVDFEKAWEFSSAIGLGSIELESGVPKLRSFIVDFIHPEIKILDEKTLEVLVNKSKELANINAHKKEEIKQKTRVDDSIDERNLKLKILAEDYKRWHKELLLIQEIMDRKQWYQAE